MKEFRADLHCHTHYSDGTLSPEAVIELAIEKGLDGLSITDHDTIEAYETAFSYANQHQFPLIPGIEFSSHYNETNVHILAYSFSLKSPIIRTVCQQHRQRRLIRMRKMLELLALHGMEIKEEEIKENISSPLTTIGRPHVALALQKKGYVTTLQEAFQKYIGEGKPCYVAQHKFSVQQTIEYIHQAKGVAILAHPHVITNAKTRKALLGMNFDGIEGYYARFSSEEEQKWIEIGKQKGWLITGGSDFHGAIKPLLPLGCSWTNEETFKQLQSLYYKNNNTM